MPARTGTLTLGLVALLAVAAPVRAADLLVSPLPLPEGVPCESPVVATFPSVWLGHFSGGRSFYPGPGTAIVLDWRDEKLCFPSNRTCNRFIGRMRAAFHRPEGYYTCLPIR